MVLRIALSVVTSIGFSRLLDIAMAVMAMITARAIVPPIRSFLREGLFTRALSQWLIELERPVEDSPHDRDVARIEAIEQLLVHGHDLIVQRVRRCGSRKR